jgi:hypothetical protein
LSPYPNLPKLGDPVETKVRPRYYDRTTTIQNAVPNSLPAEDPLYNREEFYRYARRNADKLWVVNDGAADLFVRYTSSDEGVESFSEENVIHPNDSKVYYNVFELRLRSPLMGLPYRISENEIVTGTASGGGGGGNVVVTNTLANPVITRPLDCTTDHPDICDRIGRQLGVVSLSGGAVDVSDRCARLLGQLCVAGSPIDPRAIRALSFLTDSVDVSGSTVSLAGGAVDVSDRCARLLGQLCVGGVSIDPRAIRALTNADVVTVDGSNGVALQQLAITNDLLTRPYGSQGQQLQQKAATFELLNDTVDRATRLLGVIYGSQGQQLQQKAVTFELLTDPVDRATRLLGVTYGSQAQQLQQKAATFELLTDPVDRATRLLGVTYGSQAQQLLQRALTFDLEVQLRTNGTEYDARQIRGLTFATDKVDVSGSSVTIGAITSITQFTPIQKALQHNVALPAAGADLLGAALIPTNTPCSFRISIAVSVSGQLKLDRINGGVEVKTYLNGGIALNESVEYTFDVQVYTGDTINLEYTSTGGTVMILRIAEIDASVTSS